MEFTYKYPATRSAVVNARNDVAKHFTGDAADNARLFASELAQNAVRHCTGSHFRVTVTTGARRVTVAFVTTGPGTPKVGTLADLDAENGRGLALIAALADDYGISTGAQTMVWFALAVAA